MFRVCHAFLSVQGALWLPAGKGLTSGSLVGGVTLYFVTFSYGVLGQLWYFMYRFLIVGFFLTFYLKCNNI